MNRPNKLDLKFVLVEAGALLLPESIAYIAQSQ
jgi:hypothetical protein